MATVNITFFTPEPIQGPTPVIYLPTAVFETITSTTSSQSTVNTTTPGKVFVRAIAVGGNVYLGFGKGSASVVSGSGYLLCDGVEQIFKLDAGYKVAVIN